MKKIKFIRVYIALLKIAKLHKYCAKSFTNIYKYYIIEFVQNLVLRRNILCQIQKL